MKCYLLIRHKVRDYSNWRAEFNLQSKWRKIQGERKFEVFRDISDPNIVLLLCEWKNIDSAKKFLSDPKLSEVMQVSGVMEQPSIYFLNKD